MLKQTARIAESSVRNTDILIRFGGEEFVLVMPNTKIEGAVRTLEKIRSAVESHVHPVTGKQTISIGVAQRRKNETFQDWYKRADDALYKAKEGGRNAVFAYML